MAHFLFNYTSANAKKGIPLRTQAGELLKLGMWGIGPKTPNRSLLQPGDKIVAYVGAPERTFVGRATIASVVHAWDSEESAKYPGGFAEGVSLSDMLIWEHPLPIKSVWGQTSAAKKNPNHNWQAGVVRLAAEDFGLIVSKADGSSTTAVAPETPPSVGPVPKAAEADMVDQLFAVAEKLRAYLATGDVNLSEDGTRAHFINHLLESLGYTGLEDVEHGVPVESGDFADYVLRVGERVACVEAKKLSAPLASKEAAQVVKYASVLGLRWGILTNGRYVKVYDVRVPNVPPYERLVFEVDLADYKNREDFEAQVFPTLSLLARSTIATDTGLQRRAAALAVQDLLTAPASATVAALREELKSARLIALSSHEVGELLAEMLP